MSILVDSSVWIDYFRGSGDVDDFGNDDLDILIDENLIVTNDLVLCELVPALRHRKRWALVKLLNQIARRPVNIDWDGLIRMQTLCLQNGLNRVGVPDLIIAQHAVEYDYRLFTRDRHFHLMTEFMPLEIY